MATNISALTIAGTYKRNLLFTNASNKGVLGTPASIQDGDGGLLPLAVSSTGLLTLTGAKLHFGATDNYIYNSDATTLKAVANKIVLSGTVSINGTGEFNGDLTAVSFTASTVRSTDLKSSGTASFATASAVTYKGTNLTITGTVSCATLKSSLDFTGKTETIKLGGNKLYLYGASMYLTGTASDITVKAGTAGANKIRIKEEDVLPTHGTINFGGTENMWKTVYGVAGHFTTGNFTTVNTTNGTFTSINSIGVSTLKATTASMNGVLKLNGVSMFFNTAKTYYVAYNNAASAVKLKGTLYPSSSIYDLGLDTMRFRTLYCASAYVTTGINTTAVVATGNLEAGASTVGKYLSITSIPTSSTSVSIGGVYTIGTASTLMIRKA